MQGIFIYWKEINENSMSGIDKKVKAQVDSFNGSSLKCSLNIIPFEYGLTKRKQLACRLPFSNINPTWVYRQEWAGADYIYFRRPLSITIHTLGILKKIRKNNPGVKIIMEVPTYPYDRELLCQKKLWPFYLKDVFNRGRLKKYVDRIAVFTRDNAIFGIPTLHFTNGVDLKKIKPRMPAKTNENAIHLIIVSSFEEWHGYDRIIKSLGEYYREKAGVKENFILHVVGDGQKSDFYRKITAQYNLSDRVLFYGKLYGESLDKIYDIADIAVDVFGMYRKNNQVSCSLKSREYFAKGLPVISGCQIDLLEEMSDFHYFKRFPNDETLIDMRRVAEFYHEVYTGEDKEEVVRKIREFADSTCGIQKGIQNIIDYIRS